MPLSDWQLTSAFQNAQTAFKLTEDQFHGAVDGGFRAITDPQSTAYWASTLNITTLQATAGITLETIAIGLQAGRESRFYGAMRSVKYLSAGGTVKFISLNIEAAEAALGITLLDLRTAIQAS